MVILVWGFIIYKVMKGLQGNELPAPQPVYRPPAKDSTETVYVLLADEYPDPFFNEIKMEEDTITEVEEEELAGAAPQVSPLTAVQQAAPEPPPSIKYNGYIYNPVTKKRTALITYNGNTMVVGIADKLDEKVKVLGIDAVQLVISFNGKKIVIGN